jgi:hypothetical protein
VFVALARGSHRVEGYLPCDSLRVIEQSAY